MAESSELDQQEDLVVLMESFYSPQLPYSEEAEVVVPPHQEAAQGVFVLPGQEALQGVVVVPGQEAAQGPVVPRGEAAAQGAAFQTSSAGPSGQRDMTAAEKAFADEEQRAEMKRKVKVDDIMYGLEQKIFKIDDRAERKFHESAKEFSSAFKLEAQISVLKAQRLEHQKLGKKLGKESEAEEKKKKKLVERWEALNKDPNDMDDDDSEGHADDDEDEAK